MGGGSSRNSMMGGGRGYAGKGGMGTQVAEKPPLQILDASGNDVTEILPRSLLDPTVNSREKLLGQEKANSKLQGLLGGKSAVPSAMLIGGGNDTIQGGGGTTADRGMNNPFGDSRSTRGDRSVGPDGSIGGSASIDGGAGGDASQASRSSVQGLFILKLPSPLFCSSVLLSSLSLCNAGISHSHASSLPLSWAASRL